MQLKAPTALELGFFFTKYATKSLHTCCCCCFLCVFFVSVLCFLCVFCFLGVALLLAILFEPGMVAFNVIYRCLEKSFCHFAAI